MRQVASKRAGIVQTNVLNSAGLVLQDIRIGTNGTSITRARNGYDSAGDLVTTTNAMGEVTTFEESVASGYLVRTTTYPDLSTREETFNRDGTLAKVTGTAVRPVRHVEGMLEDGSGN